MTSDRTAYADLVPVDVRLLPQTYAWPKRILCWLWWKPWPTRWITRPLSALFGFKSPYRRVVMVYSVGLHSRLKVPKSPEESS